MGRLCGIAFNVCLMSLQPDWHSIWRMAFYVILWTLWLFRFDIIFNGKVCDASQAFNTVKLRVGWWLKAHRLMDNSPVLDVMREPSFAKVTLIKGCPGASGLGGALRDDNGLVKILFSKSIGIADILILLNFLLLRKPSLVLLLLLGLIHMN
ncbi:Uncharacterized protein TCM_045281 [Theobroma cacao]|uniref:Uncharacterized protein n=1 Tax=Theobroma cacao TaxID=3641 RepID=A0A061FS22_THECC|nr:Uncharacterized protein TCM_045281 [Theobroma cacao]